LIFTAEGSAGSPPETLQFFSAVQAKIKKQEWLEAIPV
jgi:hypothetical protein